MTAKIHKDSDDIKSGTCFQIYVVDKNYEVNVGKNLEN